MTGDPEAALQRAIAAACHGGAADVLANDLPAFLASYGVSDDDIAAVAEAPARLAVYRSLVRNGVAAIAARLLPKTRAHLDAALPGRFETDLAAFLDSRGPRTHYLRDVPFEFFAWAEPRWRDDATVPPYVVDLATCELAHFEVSIAVPSGGDSPALDLALDRGIAFSESARLLRFAWAVHELPDHPPEPPARRDVRLLAYRDSAYAACTVELSPFAGDVLSALAAGATLGAAIRQTCHSYGVTPDAMITDVAKLLADLGARGAVLGGRPL